MGPALRKPVIALGSHRTQKATTAAILATGHRSQMFYAHTHTKRVVNAVTLVQKVLA